MRRQTGTEAPPAAEGERPPSKWVLFYDAAADALERAPEHFPAHHAWIERFRATGELLLIGTFADPVEDGAMCVFRSRDAAERFAEGDPFTAAGITRSWRVKEWHELFQP
jgi:uncharacterized protein YciI